MSKTILVVGGGPAGLTAAGTAAAMGADVTVLESGPRPARKLLITGKGRCNVTNACDLQTFLSNVPRNGRFLFSTFTAFGPADVCAMLEEWGVPLKTERGNRVFPVSDKAADVANALIRRAESLGARIRTEAPAESLLLADNVCRGVRLKSGEELRADAVIVATGGLSYPKTGSTGDGYRFARRAGHNVEPTSPSLVPLTAKESYCAEMAGLTLKNAELTVTDTKTSKTVFRDFGEMLFAHFGVTGPLILSASAHLDPADPGRYKLFVDLKPALSNEQLDARILRDFEKFANRDAVNALGELLPKSMILPVCRAAQIPERLKVRQITKEMRRRLAATLKAFPITVTGFRSFNEAVVTRGGVRVKEIDPKTCASKLVGGLYFAGEVLDVDAYTGGFNLQIAFSTGYAAGRAAATDESIS